MRHRRLLISLLLSFVGAAGLLLASSLWSTTQYVVHADNDVLTVSGEYNRVADVLSAAGVQLNPADIVSPPLESPPNPDIAIQVQRAQEVLVRLETGDQTYWTHQRDLAAFLNEAGVTVGRTDRILADDRPVTFAALAQTPLPAVVIIGDFVTVTVHDGDQQQIVRTAQSETVGELLREAGITIYAADNVEPAPGSWLSMDMHVYIQRSIPLSVYADGQVLETRSYHTNAADVIAEIGIGLVGQDYVRPGPEHQLQAGDLIEVVRVTEDFRLEDLPIPYDSLWQPTDQLELDQRGLLQAGAPGVLRRRIRVRYENGAIISETVDGEWRALEPVPEIRGYGTNIVIRTISTPEGAFEYWRIVRMRVTSYTAASSGKPPDHPAYGITASGQPAGTGIVAIDPTVVPFLSYLYIPGYGVGYAGDTGGGVKGRWIDLGYDEDEYVSWSGYVDVYYLTPVPDPEDINYLIPTTLP